MACSPHTFSSMSYAGGRRLSDDEPILGHVPCFPHQVLDRGNDALGPRVGTLRRNEGVQHVDDDESLDPRSPPFRKASPDPLATPAAEGTHWVPAGHRSALQHALAASDAELFVVMPARHSPTMGLCRRLIPDRATEPHVYGPNEYAAHAPWSTGWWREHPDAVRGNPWRPA